MKALLVISIVTNLGLLAVFKYTGFVGENVNALGRLLGAGHDLVPVLHIVLPVGISFYTFKAMSYAIDVYRGDARPMRRFTDYLCFEAFFPDLVAGPIIRYAALEEQMRVRAHTLDKFSRGVAFFAFGMAKKILIANPMGHVADTAFAAGTLHAPDAWFGLLGYAFQIYFDFSGYSDMACGLALMLGFVLIQNFDSPYQADSITDFWRRWHISLSTWLRDYLYIPLGGNRLGDVAHVRQPDGRDAARRALARRELELRAVGRDPRRHAGVRARAGQGQPLPSPAACRSGSRSRSSSSVSPGSSSAPRRSAQALATIHSRCSASRARDRSVGRCRGSDVHAATTSPMFVARRACSSGGRRTPGRSPPRSPRRARSPRWPAGAVGR